MTKSILQIVAPKHGFRLDTENADLEAYMRQVNGRADTYVFNAVDIDLLGYDLEKQLDDACIPSCRKLGITAVVRSAGPHKSRNTRQWSARGEGTEAHFRRYSEGWRLMHAKRVPVFGGQEQQCRVSIHRQDYDALQRRAVAQFTIATPAL